MFSLKGKTALITGGGSGIGKAIAVLFAKQEARAFILDLDEANGAAVVESIRKEGGDAVFIKCNIVSLQEVQQAVAAIVAATGALDIVVNNAGIAHVGNLEQTSEADMERLLAVNVKGVFHVLQASIGQLKKHGGVILNLASIAALVGIPDRFAYSTTKAAVRGMTMSVAKDYISYNIRCNSISPARVHTPFVDGFIAKNYPGKEEEMFKKLSATQPIGRMAGPEEVAQLALYLCSDEASFITGCDYPIDGGFVYLNN